MAAIACLVAALACSIDSKAALANSDSGDTLPQFASFLDSEMNAMRSHLVVNVGANLVDYNCVIRQNVLTLLWKTDNLLSAGVGVIPSLTGPVRAFLSLSRLLAALGRA